MCYSGCRQWDLYSRYCTRDNIYMLLCTTEQRVLFTKAKDSLFSSADLTSSDSNLTHPSFPKKPIEIDSCTFWKDSHTLPCAKASVPEQSGIRSFPKLHLESRWLNFYNLLPHGDVAFAFLKEAAICFLPLYATTWVEMDMFTCWYALGTPNLDPQKHLSTHYYGHCSRMLEEAR